MAGYNECIEAKTGNSNYSIVIGESVLTTLKDIKIVQEADNVAVIVSKNVISLHENYINESISDIKNCELLIMDDKEENKSYLYAEEFLANLIKLKFTRKSVIIAIGGGVVGDFAGYIASLYMRGIPIIQVPTTLLAMVDSSIGGKVAVNLSRGKNMVGAFHQPHKVLTDILFLNTLPQRELKNGLTEALKHGVIGDLETIDILEKNDLNTIVQKDTIIKLIARSVSFKTSVVERDEMEGGLRKILNFGHTIGHAIESYKEYKGILHGEAVAIGIFIKLEVMLNLGQFSEKEFERMKKIMDKYALLRFDLDIESEAVISHLIYDKKNFSGKINFVLVKGIGNPVFNQQIDQSTLLEIMERHFK